MSEHSIHKLLALFSLAFLATLLPDLSQSSAPSLPQARAAGNVLTFPDVAKSESDFAPPGWKIWQTASGDLNGDGRADKAFIIVPKGEDPEKPSLDANSMRVVLVALKNADGSFKCDCKNFGAIYTGQAAVAFGLKTVKIAIDKGVLSITNAGGAKNTQSIVAKFSKPENWEKTEMVGLSRSDFHLDELKQSDWQQDLRTQLVTSSSTTWQNDGNGNKKSGSEKTETQKFYRLRAGCIMLAPKIDARIDAKEWPGLDLTLNGKNIVAGKELAKSDTEFVATIGALHDVSSLFIRAGIYGNHLDPGDRMVLFDAQGKEISPAETKTKFSSTFTIFESRYEMKQLKDRRNEQKSWTLPVSIEVQNMDAKTKQPRIILSTSQSRKVPGGVLICKNPGLPLMAHWNLSLPDE